MAKVSSRLVDPWYAIWLIHDTQELGYHDARYHRIEHGYVFDLPGFQGCQIVFDYGKLHLAKGFLREVERNPYIMISRCKYCFPLGRRWLPKVL